MAGKISEAIPTPPPPLTIDNTTIGDLVEEEEEEVEYTLEEVELNAKNLEIAWDRFASHILKNRPRIGFTLQANKPTLIDDMNISFEVVNHHQKDELMGIYNELIHFLRKSLGTSILELEFIVVEADTTNAKPYTIDEKFKSMISKNPALLTLKQALGLDFE